MTCRDAREWFSASIDDALGPEDRARLDAHLADCADCRRELGRFGQTVSLLRAVEPARAPAGFAARVLEAARPAPWHRRLLERLRPLVPAQAPVAVAATLIVATLAVYVFQRTPTLQEAAHYNTSSVPAGQEQAMRGEPPEQGVRVLSSADERQKASPAAPLQPPRSASPGDLPGQKGAGRDASSAFVRAAEPPANQAVTSERPAKRETEALVPPSDAAPPAAPPPGSGIESGREAPAGGFAPLKPAREPIVRGTGSPPVGGIDQTQERREALATPRAVPPAAFQALGVVSVTGRLVVSNRQAADREVAAILARVSGVESGRRTEGGALVLQVMVPGTAYPEFSNSLAGIGSWQPDSQPADLPPRLLLTIRITE